MLAHKNSSSRHTYLFTIPDRINHRNGIRQGSRQIRGKEEAFEKGIEKEGSQRVNRGMHWLDRSQLASGCIDTLHLF